MRHRLGWALTGALALTAILALARATVAGPLDPPGPVGSTMRTIDELLPSWGKTLASSGGCSSQRFTCVMSNQAVLDHETGLVWQRVPAAGATDFLTADQTCREAKIGGRYGWRLPAIDELFSLDDDTTADSLPAGHPFTNTPDTYLWSRTADASDAQRVQTMTFLLNGGGYSVIARPRFGFNPAENARAWCVRGAGDTASQQPDEQPAWSRRLDATGFCHSARFECVLPTAAEVTGEAVLDRETGLVWQRTPTAALANWAGSVQYCGSTVTGGRMGWRAPSYSELSSLLDPAVVAPQVSLPPGNPFDLGAGSRTFWAGTENTPAWTETARPAVAFLGSAPGVRGGGQADVYNALLRYWCVRSASGHDPS